MSAFTDLFHAVVDKLPFVDEATRDAHHSLVEDAAKEVGVIAADVEGKHAADETPDANPTENKGA